MNRRLYGVADQLRRTYWRAFGPKTVGIRVLVVDDEDRVLLVRHAYGLRRWQLPGGGVKRRETLAEAALRELREETGVLVPRGAPALQLAGAFSNLREGKSDHIVVFVVRSWSRGPWEPDGEISDVAFFGQGEVPDATSPGTLRRLTEFWSAGEGGRDGKFDW